MKFDGDRLAQVGVISQGCAISTSSGSMMAEIIEGRTVAEAAAVADRFKAVMHGEHWPDDLDLGDLEALQGVKKFPVRVKCALLPWVTLLDAILAHAEGRAPRARLHRGPHRRRQTDGRHHHAEAANDDHHSRCTPEDVLEGLRPVKDPELNLSIVDLGLVRGITVPRRHGQGRHRPHPHQPDVPAGTRDHGRRQGRRRARPGRGEAAINLVWSPMWDPAGRLQRGRQGGTRHLGLRFSRALVPAGDHLAIR